MIWLVLLIGTTFAATNTSCSEFRSCFDCVGRSQCHWCNGTCQASLNDTAAQQDTSCVTMCPLWTPQLAIASALAFVALIAASAGGIGGGSLCIVIFFLVFGASVHGVIPLSSSAVFGASCGSFVYLTRRRHPVADRPLIDYNIALVLQPMTLMGSLFGVLINVTFPSFIVTICLVLVLGFSAIQSLRKGCQMRKKHKEAEAKKVAPVMLSKVAQQGLQLVSSPALPIPNSKSEPSPVSEEGVDDFESFESVSVRYEEARKRWKKVQTFEKNAALDKILWKESRFPIWKFLAMAFVWGVTVMFVFLRGGVGKSVVGIECGSWQYWLLLGANAVFLLVFTSILGLIIFNEARVKLSLKYHYLEDDFVWTFRRLVLLGLFSLIVGVLAGFVGVAGSILQGPLLLSMGVLPLTVQATTSFLILFTTSITALQYLTFGLLDWRFGLWFFLLGVVAGFIGQNVLNVVMVRLKRPYILVFFLALLTLLTLTAMLSLSIVSITSGQARTSFGSPCAPTG